MNVKSELMSRSVLLNFLLKKSEVVCDLGNLAIENSQMIYWRDAEGKSEFITNPLEHGITAIEAPRTWEAVAP